MSFPKSIYSPILSFEISVDNSPPPVSLPVPDELSFEGLLFSPLGCPIAFTENFNLSALLITFGSELFFTLLKKSTTLYPHSVSNEFFASFSSFDALLPNAPFHFTFTFKYPRPSLTFEVSLVVFVVFVVSVVFVETIFKPVLSKLVPLG